MLTQYNRGSSVTPRQNKTIFRNDPPFYFRTDGDCFSTSFGWWEKYCHSVYGAWKVFIQYSSIMLFSFVCLTNGVVVVTATFRLRAARLHHESRLCALAPRVGWWLDERVARRLACSFVGVLALRMAPTLHRFRSRCPVTSASWYESRPTR